MGAPDVRSLHWQQSSPIVLTVQGHRHVADQTDPAAQDRLPQLCQQP